MRTNVIAAASIALFLAAWQWHQLRGAKAHVANTERIAQAEAKARHEAEGRTAALERERARLTAHVAALERAVAALASNEGRPTGTLAPGLAETNARARTFSASTGDDSLADTMLRMFGRVMADPTMKQTIQAQQRTLIRNMYGGTGKAVGLTSDQNEKLLELLLERDMQSFEHSQPWFTNPASGDGPSAAIAEDQKRFEQEARSVLGDEKFAEFQEYAATVPDRAQLAGLEQQLESAGASLNEAQFEQLIAIRHGERVRAGPPSAGDPATGSQSPTTLFSSDALEGEIRSQQEANSRVLQRAAEILSPEQLKALEEFQNRQLDLQRLGGRLAREIFGSSGAAGDEKGKGAPAR